MLGSLEGEKEVMDSFTRDESKFLCTKFADKIFDKADMEDRAGEANKNTARTFYATASFLEILQQFHEDNDNSEEFVEQKKKSVYCKWKATEILKAIKEGRTPTPGGYGEENNDNGQEDEEEVGGEPQLSASYESPSEPSMQTPFMIETVSEEKDDKEEEEMIPMNAPSNGDDGDDDSNSGDDDEGTEVQLGPPPAYPVGIEPIEPLIIPPAPPMAPVILKPPVTFNPPPPVPTTDIPPPVPTRRPTPEKTKKTSFLSGLVGGNKKNRKVGKVEIADATELTRFALAALDDKDTDLAADRLHQALEILRR